MPNPVLWKRRSTFSWALYDWANSAFSTTVMAGFFPLFFKKYWAADLATTDSTFWLGAVNSMATLVIVVLAPFLGAIADRAAAKKRYLMLFALIGIVMTGCLFVASQGDWLLAIVLYGFAVIGFSGANTLYDALLIDVVDKPHVDQVSALGYALGYLGGGILFAINVLMTQFPQLFGIPDAVLAVRISFVMVAIWWAVFSLPLMLFVNEPGKAEQESFLHSVAMAWKQLSTTTKRVSEYRQVVLFLLAYWFYIDGVDTIVRMAVDYGLSLGFDSNGLITALLITQFVGFPAALVFGALGQRRGAKQSILLAIGVYLLVLLWAAQMDEQWEFYLLAVAIGLVQGGIQALSRSFYSRIIPHDRAGEFYGFYNMLGKFAAIIGPVMVGWVSVLTGSARISILSISVLFVIGAVLLSMVDEQQGARQAKRVEGGR